MAKSGSKSGKASDQPTVAVLGVGQMGLVCASILVDEDRVVARGGPPPVLPRVLMWGHSAQEVGDLMQSGKTDRLPGFHLPEDVRLVIKDGDAMVGASLIICAIPVQFIRSVFDRLKPHIPAGVPIVSVSKGIENTTLRRPTQVIAEALADDPDKPARPLGALSGPTIASELARCLPATMVAACEDEGLRTRVQQLFTTRWLRIYPSADVLGVELAGATKNVIAIAAGILDGLQAGVNAKSALLGRGLVEITRFATAMGASTETFYDVAGVGDLATTCFSPEGRNRSLGEQLGKGRPLEDILRRSRFVIEGVATTRSVMDLSRKYKVEMPITSAVYAVLFEGLDPIKAIEMLMTREMKGK
ncbi:MAG: NAD(P)H-dependent glycerol-3-phosphate dehydrogenase [Phycisphaerales bacterium]